MKQRRYSLSGMQFGHQGAAPLVGSPGYDFGCLYLYHNHVIGQQGAKATSYQNKVLRNLVGGDCVIESHDGWQLFNRRSRSQDHTFIGQPHGNRGAWHSLPDVISGYLSKVNGGKFCQVLVRLRLATI